MCRVVSSVVVALRPSYGVGWPDVAGFQDQPPTSRRGQLTSVLGPLFFLRRPPLPYL